MTSDEHRFSLYRLCTCPECEGSGKDPAFIEGPHGVKLPRCLECRGEGRTRQVVVEADTAEGIGVGFVTCGWEGEWYDQNGDPCALGFLDRDPDCHTCAGDGCEDCHGTGKKGTGEWYALPWLPSPRNLRDAGKVLRTGRADVTAGGSR